jgi:signal transduction histidine kinase
VQSILLLVKKELTSREIRLETHFSREAALVYAVEDQMKQVVLNLIQNGMEAMSESGGVLTVTIESGEETVAVRIHDNGSGISNEHLQHIFEPFFTTKSQVKGTGLGLSVSYNIIKIHGGELQAQSESGRGTTFTLTLPVYKS